MNWPLILMAGGAAVIGLWALTHIPFSSILAWLKNLLPKPGPKPVPVNPANPEVDPPVIQAVRDFISMKGSATKDTATEAAFKAIWAGMEPK